MTEAQQKRMEELAEMWLRSRDENGHNTNKSKSEAFTHGYTTAIADQEAEVVKIRDIHYQATKPMDSYFTGMFNGIEMCRCLLKGDEAAFKNAELKSDDYALIAKLQSDHEKFCEEAQEKTDADFKVVREAAERARAELAKLREENERLKEYKWKYKELCK